MEEQTTVLVPEKRKQPAHLGTFGTPPPNKLTDIPWSEIKTLIESGQSMCRVAREYAKWHTKGYDALLEVIKKRAQREKWLVPRTAIEKAKQNLRDMGIAVPTKSQEAEKRREEAEDRREKSGTALVRNLQEMGESGSLLAGRLVHDLLERASSGAYQLAPLVDIQDIASAAKTIRLVAGMDKQAAPVQFNLWGNPALSRDVSPTSMGTATGTSVVGWETLEDDQTVENPD